MFQLVIDHGTAVHITEHPSREVALGALERFLDTVDCEYRITQATWEHSSYDLIDRATLPASEMGTSPAGHAVIEEICGCGDTMADHEDGPCIAQKISDGRLSECNCPAFRPVHGEPALFDLPGDSPVAAAS